MLLISAQLTVPGSVLLARDGEPCCFFPEDAAGLLLLYDDPPRTPAMAPLFGLAFAPGIAPSVVPYWPLPAPPSQLPRGLPWFCFTLGPGPGPGRVIGAPLGLGGRGPPCGAGPMPPAPPVEDHCCCCWLENVAQV